MDRFEHLRLFLHRFAGLSETEINWISSHFKQLRLKKDEYYFKAGACCCYLSYLEHGALGVYCTCVSGDEGLLHFITKNHFFTDPDGFKPGGCACSTYRALGPSALLNISMRDAEAISLQVPAFAAVVRQIREQSLIDIIDSQYFLRKGNKYHLYQCMFDNNRELLQTVPLKHIAAYLGVTPQSLSRIRKMRK
jgi:CRP-like cAMP-binding protein